LKAGYDTLLEKPMAQTIKECDAMIAAWKKSGAVFMVGLELRYCTLCQEMKAILERGEIGGSRSVALGVFAAHTTTEIVKAAHRVAVMIVLLHTSPVRVVQPLGR
jgi:predicted dehydrogenase